jgi:tetratricopeptide (TPR) repeat protein
MPGTRSAAFRQRAVACLARGDWPRAVDCYRELLAEDPGLSDDWYNYAYALRQVGEFAPALEAYGKALERGAGQPEEIHLNRAAILSTELQRDEAAEQELRQALTCNADYAPALLNLGNLLEETGRRDEALQCYRRLEVLEGADRSLVLEARARLAHLDPPASADDRRLDELERAALAPGIDAALRANLFLALARNLDRLALHDRAFEAMRAGKRAAAQTAGGYRPARQERLVDALIDAFPSSGCEALTSCAGDARPVFVCGMYRSGSTLIEQVLSAHGEVVTGGELDLLPRLVARSLPAFPESARSLDAATAQRIAQDYLGEVRVRLPDVATRHVFTDKRPPNFLFIGLICRLFPDARIVHTCRHPLDTALSIFMQHLDARAAPYANNLADIGHYYVQYHRLMRHWKTLFPGRIQDVAYERLVDDPESEIRSLLEFLGLAWDPGCLAFHRQKTTVRTASYWQVRRPLYRSAAGRWQHYRHHLQPLRDQLSKAGVDLDDPPPGGP